MATVQLFGKKIPPACKYCSFGAPIPLSGQVLCLKKGIVSPDHKCLFFLYDPLRRVPAPPQTLPTFEPDDFSITLK